MYARTDKQINEIERKVEKQIYNIQSSHLQERCLKRRGKVQLF